MIRSVELVDFLSHHDTRLEFDAGMNVIVGPNGAGKSSVVDAITYALFGKHARNNARSLVRSSAARGYASVTFSSAQRTFMATRHVDSGQARSATLKELDGGKWRTIAAGERRAMDESTTAAVEDALGMGFEKLRVASIIRQGELDSIIGYTPKQFKELINRIIGTDKLDTASSLMGELTREFRARIRAEVGRDDTSLDELASELDEARARSDEARSERDRLAGERAGLSSRLAAAREEAERGASAEKLLGQLAERRGDLDSYVRSEAARLESERASLERRIAECEACLDDSESLERLRSELAGSDSELAGSREKIRAAEKRAAQLEEQLSLAGRIRLVDGRCPVCDSRVDSLRPVFDERHLRSELDGVAGRLAEERAAVEHTAGLNDTLRASFGRAERAGATLRAHSVSGAADIAALRERVAQIGRTLELASAHGRGDERAAAGLDGHAAKLCEAVAALQAQTSEFDASAAEAAREEAGRLAAALDRANTEYGAADERARALERTISGHEELIERLAPAARYSKRLERIRRHVFSRDGSVATSLRSWALATISAGCTEHLSVLDARIRRVTLTEDKSSVSIACHAGGDTFDVGSLSGGERISVAVALRLGMERIFGGAGTSFVVLDEPTAHLDSDHRKALARVLSGLAASRRASVPIQFIIITHDRDVFDEVPAERVYEFSASPEGTRVGEIARP